jgi:hypothetical protein
MNTIKPGTNTSFGQLQQIDAGLLNLRYAEAGKSDGRVVMLLHGWPTISIAMLMLRLNMTSWNSGSPNFRTSPCPR